MSLSKREHPRFPIAGASRADALTHGVTDWQWRDERYARPFRGVKMDPALAAASDKHTRHPAQAWRDTHLQLAQAYTCIMKSCEFFAGITAAIIWKLPTPIDPSARHLIEVGVVTGRPFPRRDGVQGRRFSSRITTTTRRSGLATLDPPSIWATLGRRLDLPDRVALGDAIIHQPRVGGNRGARPRAAHATIEELIEASEHRGRVGKMALREALPLLRTGSASAPESHLRLALVAAGLPEPELDVDVYDESGRYLGTTECVFIQFKVVLEYEGDHHRTELKQWNRDIQKYSDYAESGWMVIRITAQQLYRHRTALIEKITRTLEARGWQT